MRLLNRIISNALALPTIRVSRWVPPQPGMIPRFNSVRPTVALGSSTMIRKWQLNASSRPPPMANPLIAAITGLGKRSSRVQISRPLGLVICALAASLTSNPAEKHFSPPPVMTSTRTSVSFSISPTAFSKSSIRPRFQAFTGGWLRVRMVMWPLFSRIKLS